MRGRGIDRACRLYYTAIYSRNSLRFPMEHVSFGSDNDKEWVFGKTTLSLWKFGQS